MRARAHVTLAEKIIVKRVTWRKSVVVEFQGKKYVLKPGDTLDVALTWNEERD